MSKGQAMVLRINVFGTMDSYLDTNRLSCEKNWTPMPSTSGSFGRQAGWLADKIRLDFKILKILYRLNYLEFHFVYSSLMLLIDLEVQFSLLFSNKAYFRVCFVVCKIWSPFFHVHPYY